MGRVKRYKRIKAIDPLNPKTHGVVDFDLGKDINRAPTRKDVDAIPRAVQLMLERKGVMAGGGGGAPGAPGAPGARRKPKRHPEGAPPARMFDHVKALPGESMSSFHRRVNAERTKQLQQIRAERLDAKTVNSKRAAYLQRKKEKRALAGGGVLDPGYAAEEAPEPAPAGARKRPRDDDAARDGAPPPPKQARKHGAGAHDFPRETLAFGERAQEPPRLAGVAPRKSAKQKQREAERGAAKAALAAGRASDASDEAVAASDAARRALDAARSAEMQRAQLERYRASVQVAYSALKEKKRSASGGGGGTAAHALHAGGKSKSAQRLG
jgi:hypothetical protein